MEEIKKQNSDEMKEIKLEGNAADLADAIQTIDIEEDSIEIEEVSLNEEPEEADDIAEEKVSLKKKKSKKKIAKFWKGFYIYIGILAVFMIFVFIYVWNTMKKFQKSQPEHTVESLIETLESGDISSIETTGGSKFEPDFDGTEDLKNALDGKELDYQLKTTGSDSLTYNILVGDKVVAEATLKSDSDKKVLGIITISDWKVDKVVSKVAGNSRKYTITAPAGYKVKVNGIELGEDELKGEPKPVDNAEFIAEYTTAPTVVTYKVSGITKEPVVEAFDIAGNNVSIPDYAGKNKIEIGYQTEEISEDLKSYVLQVAFHYSDFFTGTLEGEQDGLGTIRQYFPEGSYYIDLADKYRVGDMWMYSDLISSEFKDVSVSEYTKYSDTCFSCRVKFVRSMVLNTHESREETSDETFYYVNIDGKWLVADIKSNL